jgi:hypothetical protein
MDTRVVFAFEEIVYTLCQLAAMSAANEYRRRHDLAQAYPEGAFADLAERMRGSVRDRIG